MDKDIKEAMGLVKMPFGKHKGSDLRTILRLYPSYIKWLSEDCTDPEIRFAAQVVLGTMDTGKLQTIVREALMHRGYSETEANMFIRRLKE